MDKTKSLLVSIVMVAIVTTLVVPRDNIPSAGKTINTITRYVSGSIRAMLGTS